MAATYSINTPGQDAQSYVQISDILSLLPDNTQKLISPKDVRDSIFSAWENTLFRYTTNSSSTEYVGIAREEVKGVKFFIGKKELSGSDILSNSVISANPDTDIFFFNTKSDSAPTQDLRISFLAGNNLSLHQRAPYLEAVQISGLTPSIGLILSHNQPYGGDFDFQAGDEGTIAINNLIFPSVNQLSTMISGASGSSTGDLFLVRTSTGLLSLRTGASLGNTLGVPGSPTYIFGSPVELNGFPLEFSDSNPMIESFRNFPQGTTFSNVPLVEMIRGILYPYLPPLTTITLTSAIIERREDINTVSNFNYTLIKRSLDITSSTLQLEGQSIIWNVSGPTLTGAGYQTQNYSGSFTISSTDILTNTSGIFTFSYTATDGTQSYTDTDILNIVYPYYYGFSATNSVTNIATTVATMSKKIDIKRNQEVTLFGSKYLHFMYPDTYGTLSTIFDSNGYLIYQEGTQSNLWTHSVVSIASKESGWWGSRNYRVYRTLDERTIPVPSEYKFNFS